MNGMVALRRIYSSQYVKRSRVRTHCNLGSGGTFHRLRAQSDLLIVHGQSSPANFLNRHLDIGFCPVSIESPGLLLYYPIHTDSLPMTLTRPRACPSMVRIYSCWPSWRPLLLVGAFTSPYRNFRSSFHCSKFLRYVGPAAENTQEIERMLAKPSWSVGSLFESETSDRTGDDCVTSKQLHHLLRLSALPLPEGRAEEEDLLNDLGSQLQFVKAIQLVDTEGVEPLVAVRDETEEGQQEAEITFDTLRDEFDKEEVLGERRCIRRRSEAKAKEKDLESWDVLACAPKTRGRFIALEKE